jgi:hypothetical protein
MPVKPNVPSFVFFYECVRVRKHSSRSITVCNTGDVPHVPSWEVSEIFRPECQSNLSYTP